MTSFYMLASLSLGLLAWFLAIMCLSRHHFGPINLFSLSACALSLLLQLIEIDHLVNDLEDFSTIMDTIQPIILAGCVMLVVTFILNSIALVSTKR